MINPDAKLVEELKKITSKVRDLSGVRYPRDAVTHCGRIVRIRSDVFDDLLDLRNGGDSVQ